MSYSITIDLPGGYGVWGHVPEHRLEVELPSYYAGLTGEQLVRALRHHLPPTPPPGGGPDRVGDYLRTLFEHPQLFAGDGRPASREAIVACAVQVFDRLVRETARLYRHGERAALLHLCHQADIHGLPVR